MKIKQSILPIVDKWILFMIGSWQADTQKGAVLWKD